MRDLFETDSGTLRAWGVTSQKAVCDFDADAPATQLTSQPAEITDDSYADLRLRLPRRPGGLRVPARRGRLRAVLVGKTFALAARPAAHVPRAGGGRLGQRGPDARPSRGSRHHRAGHHDRLRAHPRQLLGQLGHGQLGSFTASLGALSCKLDAGAFVPCSDPQPQSYTRSERREATPSRCARSTWPTTPTPPPASAHLDRRHHGRRRRPSPPPAGPTEDSTARPSPGTAEPACVEREGRDGSGHSNPPSGSALLHTLGVGCRAGRAAGRSTCPRRWVSAPYTVQAEQTDAAGNLGRSALSVFTVVTDAVAPVVSLTAPASGAVLDDTTPVLAGLAGLAAGDEGTVTREAAGRHARRAGCPRRRSWCRATEAAAPSARCPTALAEGTYTVRAEQSDSAAPTPNTGTSAPVTFTVSLPDAASARARGRPPGFVMAPAEERLSDALAGRYTATAACVSACRGQRPA